MLFNRHACSPVFFIYFFSPVFFNTYYNAKTKIVVGKGWSGRLRFADVIRIHMEIYIVNQLYIN